MPAPDPSQTVLLAGATGTIGSATLRAIRAEGYHVMCAVRGDRDQLEGTDLRCDLAQAGSLTQALAGQPVDTVVSCMSTRTGAPADAWAVEYDAQKTLLAEARAAGATRFVLLSAICVQKPHLAFQHAKLAFEEHLQASGLDWTIIRPTAFFKSLSGQVARVQAGKPFLVFGDGRLTSCKPISDRDLAAFIVQSMARPEARNAILPIGGPGPAITPMDQAAQLFALLGQPQNVRHVPLAMMDVIAGGLAMLGPLSSALRDKAEFARTGRYYASESMLVWDGTRYDADATPSFGQDTLWDYYRALLSGQVDVDLGAHAMF